MNKNYLHIIVAGVLAFFLLALADLIPFWMPMMGEMIALLVVSVLMLIWVGFVMKEVAHDEREVLLKMKSGRIAYLSGLGVLMFALTHSVVGNLVILLGIKLFTVKVNHRVGGKVINRGKVNAEKAAPFIQRFRLRPLALQPLA